MKLLVMASVVLSTLAICSFIPAQLCSSRKTTMSSATPLPPITV